MGWLGNPETTTNPGALVGIRRNEGIWAIAPDISIVTMMHFALV